MRYHTPELLLVGGAQNLVLEPATGTSMVQPYTGCFLDALSGAALLSDTHELWQVMWPSDVVSDGSSTATVTVAM